MNKTMVDFLKEEMKYFSGHIVYFDKPYSCASEEALSLFKGYDAPDPKRLTIERTEDSVTISIKPLKGSGKRKPYVIHMWTSK